MHNFIRLTFVSLVLAGCASVPYQPNAREVKKSATGGAIALPLNARLEDRQRAEMLMIENCGLNQVIVVNENEVVVGEETRLKPSRSITVDGLTFVQGDKTLANRSESSNALKEWHITYACIPANPDAIANRAKRWGTFNPPGVK